jgi:ADP-ribose pyrophosphatase YjhB (NUDIX family)
MWPIEHFHHCPRCGRPLPRPGQPPCVTCGDCGFTLYFNPAVSVAAFITAEDGRTLFIRRAKEPARGRLAIPGGFVDFSETAEAALQREVREEVGVEVADPAYLCSAVNGYEFKGVTYPVLDLYFIARTVNANARALDDVASVAWLRPEEINLEEIAFSSMRRAVEIWLQRSDRAGGQG